MNEIIDRTDWQLFLKNYCEQNKGRATRLGVFEMPNGVAHDYWIEDGLPLVAIDTYDDNGKTRLDIVLEEFTHSIDDVKSVAAIDAGRAGTGLDILEEAGRTTVVRFEDWPVLGED